MGLGIFFCASRRQMQERSRPTAFATAAGGISRSKCISLTRRFSSGVMRGGFRCPLRCLSFATLLRNDLASFPTRATMATARRSYSNWKLLETQQAILSQVIKSQAFGARVARPRPTQSTIRHYLSGLPPVFQKTRLSWLVLGGLPPRAPRWGRSTGSGPG